MNPKQLREHIIRPVLGVLDATTCIPYSIEAEDLLLLTACAESQCGYYIQQINGPAQGIFQMEPATQRDIYNNYLMYDETTLAAVNRLASSAIGADNALYCPQYACAMARVHYWRVPNPLPMKFGHDSTEDYLVSLALYWKDHYNTYLGKGEVKKAVELAKTYGDWEI